MRTLALAALGVLALAPFARADEGMWTYNNFPKQAVKQKYHVDITDPWLDHVRLSSVRFNNGGSGSFVSGDGPGDDQSSRRRRLHPQARQVGQGSASPTGFYAKTHDEEIKCPDLELNVLVDISDVTKDVQSVAKPGMDDAAINKAQKQKMSALEKACADRTHERCDVVTLYHGGVYNLYTYKKYTDVRLVFAPEFADRVLRRRSGQLRVPALRPRRRLLPRLRERPGAGARELPQVVARGRARRRAGLRVGQSGRHRAPRHRRRADLRARRRAAVRARAARRGAQGAARTTASAGRSRRGRRRRGCSASMNSLKAITGREEGLKDPKVMAKKQGEEAKLKAKLASDPEYAKVWDNIASHRAGVRVRMFVRYAADRALEPGHAALRHRQRARAARRREGQAERAAAA